MYNIRLTTEDYNDEVMDYHYYRIYRTDYFVLIEFDASVIIELLRDCLYREDILVYYNYMSILSSYNIIT
jgi:hypothetical protein